MRCTVHQVGSASSESSTFRRLALHLLCEAGYVRHDIDEMESKESGKPLQSSPSLLTCLLRLVIV